MSTSIKSFYALIYVFLYLVSFLVTPLIIVEYLIFDTTNISNGLRGIVNFFDKQVAFISEPKKSNYVTGVA